MNKFCKEDVLINFLAYWITRPYWLARRILGID